MSALIDLTGQRFGRLVVLSRAGRSNGKAAISTWLCQCDCGKQTVVKSTNLRSGNTVSCGCRKVKHNESHHHKTRLYNIWKCIHQRCNNPNNTNYSYYGGRGISVCDEWLQYLPFRDWAISNGYADDLTIDRIDVNGDYKPSNCRWTDMKTQIHNRRNSRCNS